MIRYLIKNNIKLMFRNTWSIATMLIAPILVIAVLSSAFSELMKSYEGVDDFSVGYRIKESDLFMYMKMIKEAGKDTGITFQEYPQGEVREIIANNDLAGFVEFSGGTYVVYQTEDHVTEGKTLEYFLHKVITQEINSSLGVKKAGKALSVETLEFMPAVNATDYYGIVYIVYFCWCGLICATGVLTNEKKYKIAHKYQVSNVSDAQLYIAKLVPVVLTVSVGMGAVTIITVLMYDIHWGNPIISALILFVMILAASAFGMMLYNISNHLAITIIALFTIVWFMGFFGGSFETYMFSSMPDLLKLLSPLYHCNRALVELSCMGHSDYVASAIIYSLIIAIVSSGIAILASYMRRRGRA